MDKALLSVSQIVDRGGKVVFSPEESYIDTRTGGGEIRRDHLEFRGGLYVMRLWVPRNQEAPFQGQA